MCKSPKVSPKGISLSTHNFYIMQPDASNRQDSNLLINPECVTDERRYFRHTHHCHCHRYSKVFSVKYLCNAARILIGELTIVVLYCSYTYKFPTGVPNPSYICRRCGKGGHFIQNCTNEPVSTSVLNFVLYRIFVLSTTPPKKKWMKSFTCCFRASTIKKCSHSLVWIEVNLSAMVTLM